MLWLIAASGIWAFSFGLIKGMLPHVDPFVLSVVRMIFALGLSSIFFRPSRISKADGVKFFSVGFVQLGLMYAPYMYAFKFLKGHEVALFTMTTPLYIAAIDQIKRREISSRTILAAALAVVGGAVVAWKNVESQSLILGCALVQLSNILFAWGQLLLVDGNKRRDVAFLFTAPYYFFGAVSASLLCLLASGQISTLLDLRFSTQEWLVMAWLGAASTCAGFLIWNYGSLKVSKGQLAVASDIKLPVAIVVSLVVFHESSDVTRLIAGVLILAFAGWMVRPSVHQGTD